MGPAAATTAPGQTIVVTAKSVKDLVDDCEYLIKSVAPEADPMVQATLNNLNQFKAGALIKGLDQNRGFGLAVTLPKDFPQGGPPSVVAAVPVSGFMPFLDSLKGFGLTVDDQPGVPGFSHKVTAPDGNTTVFVLESKGYALCSLVPDGADRIRAMDPSSWRPKGRTETALSARVQVSEIPEALKDQFLNQLEVEAGQQKERQPGESDAAYRGRIAGQDLAYNAIQSIVREGDAIALDLDFNRTTSSVALELAATARPNTAMAKTLQALNARRSRFEVLGQDAVMALWASVPMGKALGDVMNDGIDQGVKEGLKTLNPEEQRKLHARFVDLVKANLASPDLDWGVAIRRSSSDGGREPRFSVLLGMTVRDGREFDRLIRDAVAQVKPEKGVKVSFDVMKTADGTAIHQMTGPYDEKDKKDADIIKRFGKASLSFAFRNDAVLASFGEDSPTALRQALERLASPLPPGPSSDGPVAGVVRVASLGELAEENQQALRRVTAEVFPGDAVKRDRISLGLKGEGTGIRLRFAIDLPAFKLGVRMGQERQK
jgi:hypothetical protein